MAKLVKLSLEGDLTSGYEVELIQISEEERDGKVLIEGIGGQLPAAAEIYECYQTWQQNYEQLDRIYRGGEFRFLGVETSSNVSLAKCQQLSQILEQKINDWLDAPGFRAIADRILTYLNPEEDIRFLIKTSDYNLWQIPWSAWIFFETHPNAEVVFSSFDAKYGEKPIKATPRKNVRILSVFGSDENINTKPDQEQIERLKSVGAEPTLIIKPRADHLRNLLWDKSWDILFFAGHGDRDKDSQKGKIYLNSNEYLTPSEFKNTLKTAIVDRNLKIVFLNSCLGLEFAYELVVDFKIPVVIAMREQIPDDAAQNFLQYFLLEYADNKRPLYVAVRRAKERIAEEFQDKYPGLNWLPVVCQNPAHIPLKWGDLYNKVSVKQAAVTSLFCTLMVVLARSLGFLQPLEFMTYDWLMSLRPLESVDERIVIITIDEQDIQYQINEGFKPSLASSFSHEALDRLLQKISPYQPRVVGLDIFYNIPFEGKSLQNQIESLNQLIGICQLGDETNPNNPPIPPPPGLTTIGFVDMPVDSDGVIRRQLYGAWPPEDCPTDFSFNLRVANSYLEQELNQTNLITVTQSDNMSINQVIFPILNRRYGGYQIKGDDLSGYQGLLNYRNARFHQRSLRGILQGESDQELDELIRDRIVLIGVTRPPRSDKHPTPLINDWRDNLYGVEIQAQKISHIISAVLDGRTLFWWWGEKTENLWIASWSLMGGVLVWKLRSPLKIGLGSIIAIGILGGICFLLLLEGGWIPLFPSACGFLLTVSVLNVNPKFYQFPQKYTLKIAQAI
ncbi:CHASE2 domain-containing protein [Oscillatoria acuminata]|uniref:Putative transmembrane sensor domain protein n=1 Tax=Oscillatoria acuminata PCC 6304 TaxID=56110 RepID=K9TMT7_9CYAN|nr:CHASE2 domain-containing protein [Oscillatoria acuminata]AFY83850.1 putative transmembrane sensor domain protein [Oscillatoria acuminata PCC 6304]